MRITSPISTMFVLLLGAGVGLAVVAVVGGTRSSEAQQQQPSAVPMASGGLLTLQLRGAQKALTDSVKSVLLEHDPPKAWDLMIIGAKGKGQFTCELRSADRLLIFSLQRAILDGKDVAVSCLDGTPSTRGGVSIDLDDVKGGSFVLGASR